MITVVKAFFGQYLNWLIIGAFAVLLAAVGVQTVRLANSQTEYATLDRDFAQRMRKLTEQMLADQAAARRVEQELTAAGEAQRKNDDQKLRALGADVDRLGRLFRDRAPRPAAGSAVAPAAAASGSSCPSGTGAGLYREDGEFLAGEAAAAKRIAIERDSAIEQYNAAREKLKQGQPK